MICIVNNDSMGREETLRGRVGVQKTSHTKPSTSSLIRTCPVLTCSLGLPSLKVYSVSGYVRRENSDIRLCLQLRGSLGRGHLTTCEPPPPPPWSLYPSPLCTVERQEFSPSLPPTTLQSDYRPVFVLSGVRGRPLRYLKGTREINQIETQDVPPGTKTDLRKTTRSNSP